MYVNYEMEIFQRCTYKRSLGFSFSHQVVIFISESSVNLLLLSSLINSEGLRQILRL